MENLFLNHYKRKEVREEILYNAKDREVAARFGESFSKRPDVLKYQNDILELAKQGATSFHASEELWKNPLQLSPNLRKHELDELRIGWDLIIDIDCPYWEYSKLIAKFVIDSLKEHKVKSISCKFSGNKGFHIGVPFEAFPKTIEAKGETRLRFPDDVRLISSYLVHHMDVNGGFTDTITAEGIDKLIEKTGKSYNELVSMVCDSCETRIPANEKKFEFICPKCSSRDNSDKNEHFRKCKKCSSVMEKKELGRASRCPKCKSAKFKIKFNAQAILSIDSILISSRHLYRMPYSMHESSGLVSLPIDPRKVIDFNRADATPELFRISSSRFLDKDNLEGENAQELFSQAMEWASRQKELAQMREEFSRKRQTKTHLLTVESAIPEMFFPPCINIINNGMDDGKKRALFVLINFYTSVGWSYDEIEKKLVEWNEKNKEPVRMNYLLGQLRYHRQIKKKALPPNCDNAMYMKDMGVCRPDNFCQRIKNPANYSIRKAASTNENK
ncbi:hypothetical protein HYX09_05825 [Candidatus Woesearchaeota archaeon]|nr:hypothetical protein [Candidatus Woesearchaeota archaeon]